jgi:hypothetical protein
VPPTLETVEAVEGDMETVETELMKLAVFHTVKTVVQELVVVVVVVVQDYLLAV